MRDSKECCLADAMATAEVLFSLGQSEAQAIASDLGPQARVLFAREFCTSVIDLLWS